MTDSITPGVPTPGQTVGPFFGYALPYERDNELVAPAHPNAIRLHGRVLDGAGAPVPDALVEVWQPDPNGEVPRHPGSLSRDGYTFTGWGRAATDREGRYQFSTLVPGRHSADAAPFFLITVFARGLLDRLFTRAYLPEAGVALDRDALLSSLEPSRRSTLIAEADDRGFRFDIRLQGRDETVFITYARA